MRRTLMMSFLATVFSTTAAAAQSPNPVVTMSVTLPGGHTQELTAPESGMATATLGDGTEIGVRPTILDARPWTKVVVTFFKLPTATTAAQELGEVQVTTGGAAVQTKTSPPFKVAVTRVAAPELNAQPQPTTSR